jgi:hypothetical protein
LELERTNALGYSTMNLRGWFTVATLSEKTGVDLWKFKTSQGVSIRTAFDWLLPYALGEKPWTWQQISKYNKDEVYPLLLQAALDFDDPHYTAIATGIKSEATEINDLLYRK